MLPSVIAFDYMARTGSILPGKRMEEVQRKKAANILKLIKETAVPGLAKALRANGVSEGDQNTVEVCVLSATEHVATVGTDVVIRTTVVDRDQKVIWRSDIKSNGGSEWAGQLLPFINSVDSAVASNYVSAVTRSMQKTGLIQP